MKQTDTYAARIQALIDAGKLRGVREPVGISLFDELPPLDAIQTRQVYGAQEGTGNVIQLWNKIRERKKAAR